MASSIDMRKRVMVGSVTVSGSPRFIFSMNSGMTDPREHITLPYRVTAMTVCLVCPPSLAAAYAVFYMRALLMPMALMG